MFAFVTLAVAIITAFVHNSTTLSNAAVLRTSATLVNSAKQSTNNLLMKTARSRQCPVILTQQQPEDRIVNGDTSGSDLARYLVRVEPSPKRLCTGTLISSRIVVTAAHCNVDTSSKLYIGGRDESEGVYRSVSRVWTRREYRLDPNGTGAQYDFAVLELSQDAPDGAGIMSIAEDAAIPRPDTYARVAGYGMLETGVMNPTESLYQVDVPITDDATCENTYIRDKINLQRQVCAGYPNGGCDSCQGDSGGPLLQYDASGHPVLVGIVSFGYGCAMAGFPGVYLRVGAFADYLRHLDSGRGMRTESNVVEVMFHGIQLQGGLSVATIAVIVTASLVVVALIAGAALFFVYRRKRTTSTNGGSTGEEQAGVGNTYSTQEVLVPSPPAPPPVYSVAQQ